MRVQSLGWEVSPGVCNGNPLQYSCLGNPMDGGAWHVTVHRVIELAMTEHACMQDSNFSLELYETFERSGCPAFA